MNLNLGSRFSDALPYVVLALGILFYVSPFVPVLDYYDASYDLVFLSPSYVVAGVFAWLYTRERVEELPYVLAVPAVTLLILTVMWLYFEFPGPYALRSRFVFGFASVSFFYVIGHTVRAKEWSYVVASVLAYFVCLSAIVVVPPFDPWTFLALFLVLVVTLGAGVPLALVAYVLSNGDQSGRGDGGEQI